MKKKQPAIKGKGTSRKNVSGNKQAGNRTFSGAKKPGKTFTKDDHPGDEKPFSGKPRYNGHDKPSHKQFSDEKLAFTHNTAKDNSKKPYKTRTHQPFKEDSVRTKYPSSSDKNSSSGEKHLRAHGPDKTSNDNVFRFHGDKKNSRPASGPAMDSLKKSDQTSSRFDTKQKIKSNAAKGTNVDEQTKNTPELKKSIFEPGEMPLNKYVAHCGLCSRRKAVDLIKEGQITVNGQTVTEPATKVTNHDVVAIRNKKINLTKNLVYILLNKPKGYITTTDDPEGRKTVMDLIQDAAEHARLFPVGRLDRNTSGLLLLTNDGELAQQLAHPKHNIKKIYQVELDKPLTKNDFDKIVHGVTLEDGVAFVDALGYIDPKDKKQIGIEIHSGKNRIVRRIFEHLEYTVEKLDRVMYAGLTKKNISRGQWRFLTEKELILLKYFKK